MRPDQSQRLAALVAREQSEDAAAEAALSSEERAERARLAAEAAAREQLDAQRAAAVDSFRRAFQAVNQALAPAGRKLIEISQGGVQDPKTNQTKISSIGIAVALPAGSYEMTKSVNFDWGDKTTLRVGRFASMATGATYQAPTYQSFWEGSFEGEGDEFYIDRITDWAETVL